MTRMPLRHIVISSFLLALTGCATNIGDRVNALEQRVGELEQNSQTQRVVLDARIDAINHELTGNKAQPAVLSAKGKNQSGSQELAQYKPTSTPEAMPSPAAGPRYIDPAPSLAKVAAAKVAAGSAAPTGLAGNRLDSAGEPSPAMQYDPVQAALSDAQTKPAQTGDTGMMQQSSVPQTASAQPAVKPAAQAKAPAKSGSAAESAYNNALNLLESGKAAAAKQAFEKFIAEYPSSKLEPNAYYWLGESSYTLGQYDQAILTFKDVPNKYPKHHKAADAMLKTAFAYQRLGDKDNARFYLQTLLDQYPNSAPAARAKKELASL